MYFLLTQENITEVESPLNENIQVILNLHVQ